MKISEFKINEYGPLRNTGMIKPGKFSLFFGRNEKGKTLVIDALIKFLLGKRARDFKQTDRVSDDPSGFLRIYFTQSDAERTLPEDGDLPAVTKFLPSPVSPSDCRNIFIIRNSDLAVSDEAKFYTGITDKLVGLRTGDINKIRRNLLEIGKLTPNLGFRDDEKSMKLKDRIQRAERLIARMETGREKLLEDNYDRLELDIYRKSRELSALHGRIKLYEDARNRALYENSKALLLELERSIAALKEMEQYRDEDAELWQGSEAEVKRAGREMLDLREKGKDLKAVISGLKKDHDSYKTEIEILDRKRHDIEDEKLKLKNFQLNAEVIESDASLRSLLKRISVLSSVITLPIVVSWFFKTSAYLYIAGILSLFISVMLWAYEIILIMKKRRLSAQSAGVMNSLTEMGLKAGNPDEALRALGKFSEDYERAQGNFRRLETELMTSERHLKEVDDKLAELRAAQERHENKIVSLKTKSGISSLEEYRERLKIKKKKETERESLANRLGGMLGIQDKRLGEMLSIIKSRIGDIRSYSDRAEGIVFEQKVYDELKAGVNVLEDEIKEMRVKLDPDKAGMMDLEAAANDIFAGDAERIYCRTIVDLEGILARLRNFIKEHEDRREAISNAVNILGEIELEEKGRVHELFDMQGPYSAPGIFKNITGGLYDSVVYDSEQECLKVVHRNGEIIDAEKLSGGAYDQLYLATRIAIGEKLLNQEKGFFIMDDPFIKSDTYRISLQMEVLKKITEMGWQILYFSCKDEIKNILSDDIKKGKVDFFEIDWLNV